MSTTTELTLPQRAAVALGAAEHEKQLILLVEESKTITEIKNADARTQCHAAYMKLKNARVAIAAVSKTAREDATAFSKAVISEERRLIAITEAEEGRLQLIRDQWDADREAERQAKIKAEQERVAAIQARIEHIRSLPTFEVGKSAVAIQDTIDGLASNELAEADYQEFLTRAGEVRAAALVQLQGILNAAVQAEAEAARLKAEREELARLRAESEARRLEAEAKAAAEHAAAQAELQAARDKHNAEVAAQRAELERQQQEVARQQAVLEAAQRQREADAAAEEAEHRRMVEIERAEEADRALAAHAASIVQDVTPRAQEALAESAGQPINSTGQYYSTTTFKENGEPILCNADGSRSIFCDIADGDDMPATPPSLRLGQIGERLGFAVSADLLRELGIEPAEHAGRAVLFHEHQFPGIGLALIKRIEQAMAAHRMAEAA